MNSLLMTFDSVIDTDFGLFQIIKEKYNNPELINTPYLEIPKKVLLNELLNRKAFNPLSLIIQDKYKDNIDDLYDQFICEEYENILNRSTPTDLLKLANLYSDTHIIKTTVLCKNIQEKQIISKYFKGNVITELDDINNYDSIYVKNYIDCLKIKNLQGKSIYIANYKFNFDKDNSPLKDVSILIGDINKIYIIDIYNKDSLEQAIG